MSEAALAKTENPVPTPRDIGAKMAALRAQFNLTAQEVSERLHIRPRYVMAIEEGNYDLMPGKVYARGYVHTYAEFLGLNADEVVAQCFAGELPANAQPVTVAPSIAYTSRAQGTQLSSSHGHWRGYAIMGIVALVVVLVIAQFMGTSDEAEPVQNAVAPVPESMLASMRTQVMPIATNYACLTSNAYLACYSADQANDEMLRLDHLMLYTQNLEAEAIVFTLQDEADDAAAPEDTTETYE